MGLAATMAACGRLSSGEKAELDSLRIVAAEQQVALTTANEFVDIFNSSIDSVLMNEDGIIFAKDDESPALTKEKIEKNLEQYNMILERQKKRIAELDKMLGDSKVDNQQLRTAISKMQAQLQQKEAEIAQLREKLKQKDLDISNLKAQVTSLNQNVADLNQNVADLTQQTQQQTVALNTGYYIMGKTKELKRQGVLSGGFLRKKKVDADNLDVSMFITVDTRTLTTLSIPDKKPKVVSQMPSDSYTLTDNGDGTTTLTITDRSRFWGQSSFLIISY